MTLPQSVADTEPIPTRTSSVGVPAGTVIVDITLASPEEWVPSKDTLTQVTDTISILNSSAIFMVLTVRAECTGSKGVRQFTLLSLNDRALDTQAFSMSAATLTVWWTQTFIETVVGINTLFLRQLTNVFFTITLRAPTLVQFITISNIMTLPQSVADTEPIPTRTSSVSVPAGTIIVDITLTSPEEWVPSKDTLTQVTDTGSVLNSSAFFM